MPLTPASFAWPLPGALGSVLPRAPVPAGSGAAPASVHHGSAGWTRVLPLKTSDAFASWTFDVSLTVRRHGAPGQADGKGRSR